MAFTVVENPVRTMWCALDSSSTYYQGQIVSVKAASAAAVAGGAIIPLAVPAGVADLTNRQIPFGVINGFNDRTPTYATVGSNKLATCTGIITQAAQLARDWVGVEGMYSKGDPQPFANVTVISPISVLRGPVYNAAYGTACATVTDTGGADTTGYTSAGTTGAAVFTPVANICTYYCRTGANAGIYRVSNNTSTTAPDATVAFPYDVASGDTFVPVPFKQGASYIYIGGPGLYVDQANGPATNYFTVIVYKMDLSTSGREYVEFSFCSTHFEDYRAAS